MAYPELTLSSLTPLRVETEGQKEKSMTDEELITLAKQELVFDGTKYVTVNEAR